MGRLSVSDSSTAGAGIMQRSRSYASAAAPVLVMRVSCHLAPAA
jgi:hypothetical protein